MESPFDYFFSHRADPRTIESLRGEPLAAALEVYARKLHEDGYAIKSGSLQLRLLGRFNSWLRRRKLGSEDVNDEGIARFLRGRMPNVRRGDAVTLSRLLTLLRPEGSNAGSPPPTAVDIALQQYQQYLRQERSLSEATVINYSPVVRSFLSECFPNGAPVDCQQITASSIAEFITRQAAVITSKRAPLVVTALRSFLHYLFNRGSVAIDLATCVPTIATWSLSQVPRFLPPEQIQKGSWIPVIETPSSASGTTLYFCSWLVSGCEPAK